MARFALQKQDPAVPCTLDRHSFPLYSTVNPQLFLQTSWFSFLHLGQVPLLSLLLLHWELSLAKVQHQAWDSTGSSQLWKALSRQEFDLLYTAQQRWILLIPEQQGALHYQTISEAVKELPTRPLYFSCLYGEGYFKSVFLAICPNPKNLWEINSIWRISERKPDLPCHVPLQLQAAACSKLSPLQTAATTPFQVLPSAAPPSTSKEKYFCTAQQGV